MFVRLLGVLAAAITIVAAGSATAATPDIDTAQAAAKYIKSLQNPDGGFPAFGTESAPGSTLDAVFALVAAGYDPKQVAASSGVSPDEYLVDQSAAYATGDPGATAKLALGFGLMGMHDAAKALVPNSYFDGGTGAYGDDLFDAAFYIFALVVTGEPVPAEAAAYLAALQQPDGGWEFAPGFGTETNTTAFVVQALIASGVAASSMTITDALSYLATAQNADGGFGFFPGLDSDPNSTAVVLQALVAAGENIDKGGPWDQAGNTPLDGLMTFYNASTGAFQYFGSDSAFATYQAVPAVMLGPFPAARPPKSVDTDGDGCPDAAENGPNELTGGRRDYLNPWDYMNPTQDGTNRVDDVLVTVGQYFVDAGATGYTTLTDRTALGPNAWNLGKPNGVQRVDDILASISQYFHDCS